MQFQQWLSVDEIIIPYNSRHECKQFIRGKPIHFAYKLQSLALSTGSMYGDPHTLLPETGLGQKPSVVLGLAEQAQVPQVIHDNLFTSLLILIALLNEISKRRYGSSGTERQNYWKDKTLSQWQQTWRRNTVRPLPRDGTWSDVPLTKSHKQKTDS